MKNLIIFLSTFMATILIVIFASAPAHANFGGGGAGGETPENCTYKVTTANSFGTGVTPHQACVGYQSNRNAMDSSWVLVIQATASPDGSTCNFKFKDSKDAPYKPYSYPIVKTCPVEPEPDPDPDPDPEPEKPPVIPDPGKPSPDCNVCNAVYDLNLKITNIQNNNNQNNYDMRVSINNMQTTINNIDNSITDLSVNQSITNNNITNIMSEINNLSVNIENNNITQNEIKNEINNINNVMNDYSLQLGDIKLAMGDIDVKLDNTNKLVLDLGLDLDFIKNNLVNGSPEGKDYTGQLNEIIELLKPCVPTEEKPCSDDDAVVKKLKEMQDFMQADFVPDTDSTVVEVEDLTDIELDRNLINFGVAQCPPDSEFSTMVNGFSFSGGFKHKPLCDFFTMLAPFIKAFGGFSAALILGGGLRK